MPLRLIHIVLPVVFLISSFVQDVSARTWRVALDGSGDTDSIHEAAQWAASGDTVYLAPGRYSELFRYEDDWGTVRYVGAFVEEGKDLTFRGESTESVVVGPLQYQDTRERYYGIYWWSTATLVVESITFVNHYFAVVAWGASLQAHDCVFSGNMYSIDVNSVHGTQQPAGSVVVTDCLMESGGLSNRNIRYSLTAGSADSTIVRNCRFLSSGDVAIFSEGMVRLEDSLLSGTRTWVGSPFEVSGCTITDQLYVAAGLGEYAMLRDNRLRPHASTVDYALRIGGGNDGVVELIENTIEPATKGTILMAGGSARGSGNHILNGNGSTTVRLENYPLGSSAVIDLRYNYWGTADSTNVADWIWDGEDDPGIFARVDYMPMSTHQVPTEQKSLGGLKAIFR